MAGKLNLNLALQPSTASMTKIQIQFSRHWTNDFLAGFLENSPLLHKHCMVSISLTNVMGCCIVSFQNKTFDILKSKGV